MGHRTRTERWRRMMLTALSALMLTTGLTQTAAAVSYSETILAADPLAYWRLGDSGGGLDGSDSSGNGYNGTATAGAGTTAGAITGDSNGAYQGGAGQYLALPPVTGATGTNMITIETWIRVTDAIATQPEAYQGVIDSSQDNYIIYLDKGSRELRFKVATANGAAERPGVSARWVDENLDQWIHVVGVLDPNDPAGTSALIYVNGVLRDRHTNAGLASVIPPGQLAAIGADYNNGNPKSFFTGGIDELAIYDRALTQDEIISHYELGSGQSYSFPEAVDAKDGFQIIGHRGNSMFAPENTTESNHQAIEAGADYFEVDVRLTADNQAVIMHDNSLSRTTGTAGTISGSTLDQLQALDADYAGKFGDKYAGAGIPTLNETLALAKSYNSGVVLDVKVQNAGAAIWQSMQDTGFDPGRAIAFGWNDASILDLTSNLIGTDVYHIGFWSSFAAAATTAARGIYLDTLLSLGVDGLVLDFYALMNATSAIQEDLLILAALRDLPVFGYTVDDPVDMADLMSLAFERMVDGVLVVGQFSGIITDDPATALRVLNGDSTDVPEPATLSLLLAGGLLAGWFGRRRRRIAA